ncbi:FMN-dependent NADH-azoreductase [Pararhizobium sp. IMCC21322]|uniref:FMN-dependent NADH-azoreductase n=1 Tax=Pararhizobium sp. IMCC21322 TaxID=3067903 RepID=UPI0027422D59|nr:NAD(P)H-dependent oxidoreductase [Pararhizobium sp. IMCC21322]
MATLLHIDASARSIGPAPERHRSLSRQLSQAFVDEWLAKQPKDFVIQRDVGLAPPPAISQDWIEAAFTPPEQRNAEQEKALALSNELIAEIEGADIIVLGTPMYNYGMPAALKAWFDQVIRVDKTFTFDLARGDFPLEPVLTSKTLVMLVSRGEFGFAPGCIREDMNHLETHIRVAARYLGVARDHLIAIEYQEFGDDRHNQSIADAFAEIPKLVGTVQAYRSTEERDDE